MTQNFTKDKLELASNAKWLGNLHQIVKANFVLPSSIRESNDPERKLNALLANESIFSFSFVRHPFKR